MRGILLLVTALVVGCTSGDFRVDMSIELSDEVPTVATVRWEANDAGAETWLEASAGSHQVIVPATLDDEGIAEVLVLGLKADKGYDLRVVERRGEEELRSQSEELQTGPTPPVLADLEADRSNDDHDGYLFTSIASEPSWAVIIDADGDYVWWHQPDDIQNIFIPRVVPSWAGDGIIYHAATTWIGSPEDHETTREMLHVAWDGTVQRRYDVVRVHHDFVELPDGTIAAVRYHTQNVGDEQVEGDRIVEFRPDGTEVEIWSIWDHEEYDPDVVYGTGDTGWTHCNALDYDVDEQAYYISSRHLHTIYKVDRATGDLLWRFGGDHGDFAAVHWPPFECQHQFEPRDGGLMVFDNSCPELMESRAVEFTLDEDAGLAQEVWSHQTDPPLWSYGFGDVTRLDSGNTLITWSTAGQMNEVTPDGDSVWQLNEELGGGFGYTVWRGGL